MQVDRDPPLTGKVDFFFQTLCITVIFMPLYKSNKGTNINISKISSYEILNFIWEGLRVLAKDYICPACLESCLPCELEWCSHSSPFWALKVALCFISVPDVVAGHQLSATVTELSPWVEYEFRVLASNTIGTGEPSKPSKQARTKGTCTYFWAEESVLPPIWSTGITGIMLWKEYE